MYETKIYVAIMLKYYNYVTGFAKTVPNCIRTEIQFIAELYVPCKPTLLLYPEKPNTWLWMTKFNVTDSFLSTLPNPQGAL